MSKCRSMYPGSSGSVYNVNKNSPGNGNGKWQGLWPSVGHARNARHINIEAGGNNRNVVFCMNQLGGVGRISNMFATTADGVQDCKDGQAVLHGGNITTTRGVTLGAGNNVKISWTGGVPDQNTLKSVNDGDITFSLPDQKNAIVKMGKATDKEFYIQINCLKLSSPFVLQVEEKVSASSSPLPLQSLYSIGLNDNNSNFTWGVLSAGSPNEDSLKWLSRGITGGPAIVSGC